MPLSPGSCTAPRAAAWPARSAWRLLACALVLVLAQWLVLSHGAEHGHGHEGEEPAHACAICLFKGTGQDSAGPLPARAQAVAPVFTLVLRVPVQAQDAGGQVAHLRRQARGPPQTAVRRLA